jgi:hypothetical protein
MFLSLIGLGVLSAGMIWGARRLFGGTAYADAIFPISLLHFGFAENLLQGWNIQNVTVTVLAGVILLVIVTGASPLTIGQGLGVAVCLHLLPLSGAAGVVLTPPLAVWLAASGVLWLRSSGPHRLKKGLLQIGLGVSAVCLAAVSSPSREELEAIPLHSHSWKEALKGSLAFLSQMFGPGAKSLWPFSGILGLGLLLLAAGIVVKAWWEDRGGRFRLFGLFCFLGAVAGLSLGLGWGRSGLGWQACYYPRYVAFAAPALCCVYFLSGRTGNVGTSRWERRTLLQMFLFTFSCVVLLDNARIGLKDGETVHSLASAFEEDVMSGMPTAMLADRYTGIMNPSDWPGVLDPSNWPDPEEVAPWAKDQVVLGLQLLRDARLGVFRHLRENLSFREIPVAVAPVAVEAMGWENGAGHGSGPASALLFSVGNVQQVYAVRVTFVLNAGTATAAPAHFRVLWRQAGESSFQGRKWVLPLPVGRGERTETFWVNQKVSQLKLCPDDKPFFLRLKKIALIVPVDGSQGA